MIANERKYLFHILKIIALKIHWLEVVSNPTISIDLAELEGWYIRNSHSELPHKLLFQSVVFAENPTLGELAILFHHGWITATKFVDSYEFHNSMTLFVDAKVKRILVSCNIIYYWNCRKFVIYAYTHELIYHHFRYDFSALIWK